jgi:hypothetical protein
LLEVLDEGYGLPCVEQICEDFALPVADFESKQAAGLERGVGLRDEVAVDVQAGSAGEERGVRFVVVHLRVEFGGFGERDVRRVADDGVEGLMDWQCQKVRLDELDTVGNVVSAGVGFGDFEGLGRDVGGGDFGLREMDR